MSALVLRGDARRLPLPDASVDLIVTSPPYFALRDYRDGAESLEGQIGAEATPAEYIAALLDCTREWIRVLKPSGSIFVNLSDKYALRDGQGGPQGVTGQRASRSQAATYEQQPNRTFGVAAKSLTGLPWRYALGCVDDLGLILRAEIIWSKPNGLPESVTDRVRRSHETWFHFTKKARYFSAVDEIREPQSDLSAHALSRRSRTDARLAAASAGQSSAVNPLGKLPGSVWEVASQPLKVPLRLGVDHFAAFPMELPRRIVLGWSPTGICTACGEGRRPVVSAVGLDMSRPQARRAHALAEKGGLTEEHLAALLSVGISDTGRGAATQSGTGKNTPEIYQLAAVARTVLGGYAREYLLRRPTVLSYVCSCAEPTAPTRPAVVLDPFGGTGTTALVASAHGRHSVTVDRSADYCRIAQWRTANPAERARALGVAKPPPVTDDQIDLFGMGEIA